MKHTDHKVLGLTGVLITSDYPPETGPLRSQLFRATRFRTASRFNYKCTVDITFDDACQNGHQTFHILSSIYAKNDQEVSSGSNHEEIARFFPELKPFFKWHEMTTDGPMGYISNTIYHAGERDCDGLLKGEARQIRNGKTGRLAWKRAILNESGGEIDMSTLPHYVDQNHAPDPIPAAIAWIPWTRIGEGKERNLEFARHAAVWPEATDEILCLPKDELTRILEARLPKLIADFHADMDKFGFEWRE